MGFYADLHVHSKHSRATSKDGDLEHMAHWARRKGVAVLGTGDFTHPAWIREIEEKLVPAEPGLFRLRPEIQAEVDRWPGAAGGEATRFLLEVEISTIYKKGDRTRKVHHCIYAPDLEKAKNLIRSLSRIGNLASDGRPILGLDSRDLLEITLGAGEACYLIPAHIWTPWFAALGSKSGFDTIEECYGDLAREIFAVETGLSSDPPMNSRLSKLDRFTLVSNSDAHSPPKIGREACRFECDLDYFAMRRALQTGERYGGTVEFFAEEGKYHLDGHRECGVRLTPEETRERDGLCPVCGKPLTLGVLYRVDELADRPGAETPPPRAPFRSLVPLDEVLAEVEGAGPQSKAVQASYEKVVQKIGTELDVLESAPLEDVARGGSALLAEAISRMREGRVIRQGGFDGQYGTIRLFEEGELDRKAHGGGLLFDFFGQCAEAPAPAKPPLIRAKRPRKRAESIPEAPQTPSPEATSLLDGLDPDQRAAAGLVNGPLMIVAGPGAGKTRTLTHRIAYLVREHGVPPEQCLAVTFTRRAAREMRERLEQLLPGLAARVPVQTLHALGLSILEEHGELVGVPKPLRVVGESEPASPAEGLIDFDSLISLSVRLLSENPSLVEKYRARFRHVSVDECQDVNAVQYELIRLLVEPCGNLCMIGDPDQSIYGFRGADPALIERLQDDFPAIRTVVLSRNYRSSAAIVEASLQLIAPASRVTRRRLDAMGLGPERIEVHHVASDRAEAELVVHSIEKRIGGSAFFSMDSGRVASHVSSTLSFADFAVLYRTNAQAEALVEALARSGIPFQKRSHDPLGERLAVHAVLERLVDPPGGPAEPDGLLERLRRAAREARAQDPDVDLYLPALEEIAMRSGDDPHRFRSGVALATDVDLHDPRAERVSLLTLHASKGLEFAVVFVVGLEDGILPLRFGAPNEVDLAEERRLLFVGMTRAKRELVLTRARQRAWRGQLRAMEPSPFLSDIEARLVALDEHRAEMPRDQRYSQLTLFEGL